jgi:hypothetical protein
LGSANCEREKTIKKLFMKKIIILAVLLNALTAKAFGASFCDSLTNGLNPTFWSISQSTPGLYSVNATASGVALAEVAPNPGGFQSVSVNLNLAALGWSLPGDFSMQIQYMNTVGGPYNDQVQLDAFFADDSVFFDVFEPHAGGNVHVWNGSANGLVYGEEPSGTFVISRTGSTLTGYFDGTSMFSESNTSVLTNINFSLQNQSGSDYPSVTFYGFSVSGIFLMPVVTWLTPSPITNGTALSSQQLDATANVPGSFAYTPTNGAVLNTGTNTLIVIFTPADTNDYSTVTNSVNLVVTPTGFTVPPPIINIQNAVYLTSTNLLTGFNYRVQASPDLINWTNQGIVFTATNSNWQSTNYWNVKDWNQLFFQVQVVP